MARDTVEILRSSVPLLRPQDRCPGEIYVNFADRIFGYIDAAGVPQDVGPLVFTTVAALAAYDAAVAPPNGVLAFAADAFFLKETGGTAAGLPGWRRLELGGGGGGEFDDTELRRLIAEETQNRIDGDATVTAVLRAEVTVERTARIDGDTALASQITTLSATVDTNDTNTNARITQESIARAEGDDALANSIITLDATVVDFNTATNARITAESTARASGDDALASEITTLEASVVSKDTATNARVTSESQARVSGDVALGVRIDNIEAGGGTDLTPVFAAIDEERLARIDGDSALASQIVTLEASVTDKDVATNARISTETQARVDGDNALASRAESLEAFRSDAQVSGGNLLQNGMFLLGSEPWDFLGTSGWAIEPRDTGPSEFALVTRAPGTVRANGGDYLPAPSRRLDFEVFIQPLDAGGALVGDVLARLELGTATGQPLPALLKTLTGPLNTITRLAFDFDLPEEAALWRLAFSSAITGGAVELRAPFLGLRGQDFTSELTTLGARITDESVARIDGDDALATRSSSLEAFKRDAQRNGGNLIDNSTLSIDEDSWVLGQWQVAARTNAPSDKVFVLNAGRSGVLKPNDGEIRPLAFEALALWFWLLDTPATTGSVTATIYGDTAGVEQVVASQTYIASGDTSSWRVEQFAVEMPAGVTGWRAEFSGNALTGRFEVAVPFVGFAGQDFSSEFDDISARITAESLARVSGDTALAQNSVLLEARIDQERVERIAADGTLTTETLRISAVVADETIARVAGDTALARRSTITEAQLFQRNGDSQPIQFGAYASLDDMVNAGWDFLPPLSSGSWSLVPSPFDGGGQNLRFDGVGQDIILQAPKVPSFGDPWRQEAFRARWVFNRDGAPGLPTLLAFAGWFCFNNAGERLNTDFGALSAQAGFNTDVAPSATTQMLGYAFGQAQIANPPNGGTGAGDVGRPGPTLAQATPLPFGTTFFRPAIVLNPTAGAAMFNLEFLRLDYGRVTQERVTRAAITSESTARVSGDEALAMQIQQIIAEGSEGAQTFYQPNAPANPEPGWLWFRDTGPGVPDEIFRWSGTAWVRIDTAQANDLSALQAQISDESQARIVGDVALAQRTSSLEATSVSTVAGVNANTNSIVVANARIDTESQARVSGDNAQAQRSSNIETNVNGLSARVTTNEQSLDGIEARYSVTVDANGRVAGIALLSGAGGSLFDVLADAFRVFNPASGTDTPVFEARDGRVFIRDAFIPLLGTSNLRIDDVVLDTNPDGELTIKQKGITTNFLGQNAAVRPYTFFGQGSWTVAPRNQWVDAQVSGLPAQITVVNPPFSTGFLEIVLVFGASNGGNDDDTMGFRILRSDGVQLPQVYTNVNIFETFGRNAITTLHFFDEGVPAGQTLTYRLQVQSNDSTPVRSITLLGKLFKNASSAVGASA